MKYVFAAILVLCLGWLLRVYFDSTYFSIAVIVLLGLLSGIAGRSFVGYLIPGKLLFRYRFIVYGAGFGLVIGLLLFLTRSVKNETFLMLELVTALLIAVPVGIVGRGLGPDRRFTKLKERALGLGGDQKLLLDFATLSDNDYITIRGLLVLSPDKMSFYATDDTRCLFESSLPELNPIIEKSKLFKIPNGFSIKRGKYRIYVDFPYYWMKTIQTEVERPSVI